MYPVEDDQSNEHQCPIKNIQVYLMGKDISAESLGVLGDSDDRSYHNKCAGGVEHHYVLSPWKIHRYGEILWILVHAQVEIDSHSYENAEADNLNEETDENDL